jgi:Arc/MetJ family transcription regulator
MHTMLKIDEELLGEAQRITGINETTALITEGLRALIERESARRLATLAGSETDLETISRRQPD